MANRRTKEQRIIAQLRRQLQEVKPTETQTRVEITKSSRVYHSPNLILPALEIKRDLYKTVIVLAVAVTLQVGLWQYLQHGGWEIVRKILVF